VQACAYAAHSFIRVPAGAAGAHFTKAGARSAINLSPEPFSNRGASLAEDALVPAASRRCSPG
jgi:hypothetical protein